MRNHIHDPIFHVVWLYLRGSRPQQVLGVQTIPNIFKTYSFHAFGQNFAAKDKLKSKDDTIPQAVEDQ